MAVTTGFENRRFVFIRRPCRFEDSPNDYLPTMRYTPDYDIQSAGGKP